jgi:tRNA(fMet)-specific endonuclease VapC
VKYLLDTNTVIYFFKGQGSVAQNLLTCHSSDIAISAIVYYELKVGIAKSTAPHKRAEQLSSFISQVDVLPFAEKESDIAASIRAKLEQSGTPIGPLDTLIAATALAHNRILVTRNTAEFSRVLGLNLLDWY